jgi:AcrR family transcriptional regulator
MNPSLRILRALADEIAPPPCRTRRQSDRHERVLSVAEGLMARFGCRGFTFRGLAIALRMATSTLRFHYVDLDAVCGDILRIHLRHIADAIGKVPYDAENRRQLQRVAYLAATRTAAGSLTDAHLILTRDRHFLPADELESIEDIRQGLSDILTGPGDPDILPVLDSPWIGPDQIAGAITLLTQVTRHPASLPAPAPEPPPATTTRPPPAEPRAEPPAEPPAAAFVRFNIQDIPLPLPGSLAAMTDAELDEVAEAALDPATDWSIILPRITSTSAGPPRFPLPPASKPPTPVTTHP